VIEQPVPVTTSPARSYLVVPGSDAHKVAKALASSADRVVIDLEDAVVSSAKDAARDSIAKLLGAIDPGRVLVRVNAPRSPWCHLDVIACASLDAVLGVVVPKVSNSGDLQFVDRLVAGAEAKRARPVGLEVHALIENAEGLANLADIVTASDLLTAITIGYADLAVSLGYLRPPRSLADRVWAPAQQAVVQSARAAGIAPINGPYLWVDDDLDYREGVAHAAGSGFDGTWVIHPRQIDFANTEFTPNLEQVGRALAVLAALVEAEYRGNGAASLDGQMLDEALALNARRILARAGVSPGEPSA
jgi:citrate lyase subunit beta/citryl-CoA lyase